MIHLLPIARMHLSSVRRYPSPRIFLPTTTTSNYEEGQSSGASASDDMYKENIPPPAAGPPATGGSQAYLAFNPYLVRRLNTFLPLRVIETPDFEETLGSLERMFEGWEEICLLGEGEEVIRWEVSAARC
jgi:hypothetical protein